MNVVLLVTMFSVVVIYRTEMVIVLCELQTEDNKLNETFETRHFLPIFDKDKRIQTCGHAGDNCTGLPCCTFLTCEPFYDYSFCVEIPEHILAENITFVESK